MLQGSAASVFLVLFLLFGHSVSKKVSETHKLLEEVMETIFDGELSSMSTK